MRASLRAIDEEDSCGYNPATKRGDDFRASFGAIEPSRQWSVNPRRAGKHMQQILLAMLAFRNGRLQANDYRWNGRAYTEKYPTPSTTFWRLANDAQRKRPASAARSARKANSNSCDDRPRRERWLGRRNPIYKHPHRRHFLADHRRNPCHWRRRQGRPGPGHGAGGRRSSAGGRVLALRKTGEHHDRSAFGVHVRSDARGPRSRHRRQARRPGPG